MHLIFFRELREPAFIQDMHLLLTCNIFNIMYFYNVLLFCIFVLFWWCFLVVVGGLFVFLGFLVC